MGFDLLGVLILPNCLLVNVRDRLHFWIELWFEYPRQVLMSDRGLFEIHLPMFNAALLDNLDRFFWPRFKVMKCPQSGPSEIVRRCLDAFSRSRGSKRQ